MKRPQRGCTSGRFFAARVQRTTDPFDVGLEALRMDATYAPANLPYAPPMAKLYPSALLQNDVDDVVAYAIAL